MSNNIFLSDTSKVNHINTFFVQNVPEDATEETVLEIFSKYKDSIKHLCVPVVNLQGETKR